jgi:anti-sigma B factor antagonist
MFVEKHMRLDGSMVLVLSGELDLASAPEVRQAGRDLIAADGCTKFMVDLMDVSFIDSTGIGTLIALRLAAEKMEVPFVLLDPSNRVTRLLELTALTHVFDIERLNA